MLEDYLRKIYDGFDVSEEIEPTAFREVLRIINTGAVQGLTEGSFIPTHHESFLSALRHSNEVFSAFKTHAMGTKMAERLFGEDGKLRSFEEWRKAVDPIARPSSALTTLPTGSNSRRTRISCPTCSGYPPPPPLPRQDTRYSGAYPFSYPSTTPSGAIIARVTGGTANARWRRLTSPHSPSAMRTLEKRISPTVGHNLD